MDMAALMQMMQALRSGGQGLPPGLLGPPGGPGAPGAVAPPVAAPGGYMRPTAPLTGAAGPSGGLLSDNPMAAGAPVGFPAPNPPPASMMPMDRLRAMGAIGGQPFGMRVNTALPALPSWVTAGGDPLAQMKRILTLGTGPMLGQAPAAPAAAAQPKVPATIDEAVKQLYGGNSRNQGSAGDNAGHPAASGGGGNFGGVPSGFRM